MQFTLDGEPTGAVIAGSHVRPAEELVTALRKGSYLRKYGRRGRPKTHYFRLSPDDKELVWDSSNGKVRSIPLVAVVRVQQGQATEVFSRDPLPELEAVSFSLIYAEGRGGAKRRSLDVICRSVAEFETWYWGIQLVIAWTQNAAMKDRVGSPHALGSPVSPGANGLAPGLPSAPASPRQSHDRLLEIRQIAAALQPAKAAPAGAAQRGGAPAAAGAAGALAGAPGMPAKREIGDCYIWGDVGEVEPAVPAVPGQRDSSLQSCCVPVMVTNTHALDITQVAVGARHAALLTRGGEVYSWGSGQGGKLGNGTTSGSSYPQQVVRLSGRGAVAVSCGHSYSGAVLPDGTVFTWGSGLGGQLGLGGAVLSTVWPTRIRAELTTARVEKLSCGPFHAAAISADGRLFTWGDGAFGKLGHGDHATCYSPRCVEALADHRTLSVSCGWWHTAAAALPRRRSTWRDGLSDASSCSSSEAGDEGGRPPRHRTPARSAATTRAASAASLAGGLAAAADAAFGGAAEAGAAAAATAGLGGGLLGGAMFTWGGDFTWQQRGKRDHHEGCLGLGDLGGRLVPTVVKGEDDIKQVACGLNFTVALTSNGEVLQMGRTGAANCREHNAMWEGARVPVVVSGLMATHYADALSCGMSHVAVVATPRGKRAGGGATAATRLLTWGQGSKGQLGLGEARLDHLLPQLVSAVSGRRILHLACGGHYTLAVCEHDPRAQRWSRESADPDSIGTAPAPAGVSGAPSRTHLNAVSVGASSVADRPLSGGRGGPGGGGGLVPSGSTNSLASSVVSSVRGGEAGGGAGGGSGGSGGGGTGLLRRSERGRIEGRASERGVMGASLSSGLLLGPTHAGGRAVLPLTRSVDRSGGGAAGGGGGSSGGGGLLGSPSGSLLGLGAAAELRAAAGGLAARSPAGGRGLLAAGGGPGGGVGGGAQGADVQLMSLQVLAAGGSTKRGRLSIAQRLRRSGGPLTRNDSATSTASSRHAPSEHALQQQQQQRGRGGGGGGGGSFRHSYNSVRSDQDLMTNSTNSSLSVTPSPSMHSLQGEGGGAASLSEGPSYDFSRQLSYWQQRAANMEQQLTRKTHELEQLQQELRNSTTSLPQQQPPELVLQEQQQQQVAPSLRQSGELQPGLRASQSQAQARGGSAVHWAASPETPIATPVSSPGSGSGSGSGSGARGQGAGTAPAAPQATANGGGGVHRGASLASWMWPVGNSKAAGGAARGSGQARAAAAAAEQPQRQEAPPLPPPLPPLQPQQQQQQQMGSGRGSNENLFAFGSLHPAPPTGLTALRSSCPGAVSGAAWAGASEGGAAGGQGVCGTSLLAAADELAAAVGRRGGGHVTPEQQVPPMVRRSLQQPAGQPPWWEPGPQQQPQQQQQQPQEQQKQKQKQLERPGADAQERQEPATEPWRQQELQQIGQQGQPGEGALFQHMGSHSSQASRVLALFQQSQRQREQLEELEQLQQLERLGQPPDAGPALQPGRPAAAAGGISGISKAALASAFCVTPQSLSPPVETTSPESLVSPRELQQLREQNRLLQQQLRELQASAAQGQLPGSQALLGQERLGGALSGGGAAAATQQQQQQQQQHRTTSSGLGPAQAAGGGAGTGAPITQEVAPGVYLTLQPLPAPPGGYELTRVRFSKRLFTADAAELWWAANRDAVRTAYCTAGAAGGCAPPQQQEQGQEQPPSGGGLRLAPPPGPAPVVSVTNPHPLGQPAAATTGRGLGLADIRTKRFSSGDWSPGNTPRSLGGSGTYELDPLRPALADGGLSRLGRPTLAAVAAGAGSSVGGGCCSDGGGGDDSPFLSAVGSPMCADGGGSFGGSFGGSASSGGGGGWRVLDAGGGGAEPGIGGAAARLPGIGRFSAATAAADVAGSDATQLAPSATPPRHRRSTSSLFRLFGRGGGGGSSGGGGGSSGGEAAGS